MSEALYPLAVEAAWRLFAWPSYELEELVRLFTVAGPVLTRADTCLYLRYDAAHDPPLDQAGAALQAAFAQVLGAEAEANVLLVDDPLGAEERTRLGASVHALVALPSSEQPARAALMEGMGTRVVDSTEALEGVLAEAEAFEPAPPPVLCRVDAREARLQALLDRSIRDDIPYIPPFRMDVSVTSDCNIRCRYCWQQIKTGSKLNFEHLADVLDTISVVRPPVVDMTGGEPTIWPDFERFLQYARAVGVTQFILNTNGVRLRKADYAERIVSMGANRITVSLDTTDSAKHQAIRTFPYRLLQAAFDNLSELQERYDLKVTLASVISKAVEPEDIDGVRKLAEERGWSHQAQAFSPTAYREVNERFLLSPDEHAAFKEKLDFIRGTWGEVVRREANPLTETCSAVCYKGITTVKVLQNGDIKFCWMSRTIGNLLQEPFIDIWTGARARAMRRFVRERRCNCNFDCDVWESLHVRQMVRDAVVIPGEWED